MNPPPRAPNLPALLESRDFLRKLALSLVRDEERAEDLVQEVWVRALERPPSRPGAMRKWLNRVLRNLATNQGLREAQRPAVERQAARSALVEEERDLELEGQVLDAVRGLKQPYRSAVYLRYYRGLSPSEMARELSVPEATVKTRLRRGLEHLRADLDRRHDGDRREWCSALVALAAPELFTPLAAPLPLATIAKGVLKGSLFMNKPVTAAATAITLVALASVAWIVTRDSAEQESSSNGNAALAPRTSDDSGSGTSLAEVGDPNEGQALAVERSAVDNVQQDIAATTAPTSSGIFGRVIDEAGRPVAGASVRGLEGGAGGLFGGVALSLGGPELDEPQGLFSAADGSFRVPVAEDGPLELIVKADGFAPFRKEVTGYFDLATNAGDLVLQTGVKLGGRVVTADGVPVEGARIASSSKFQSGNVIPVAGGFEKVLAVTDAAGRFEIDQHAVGPWSLLASTDTHPKMSLNGTTSRAGEHIGDIEFVLEEGVSIAGRILGMPRSQVGAVWVRAAAASDANFFAEGGLRIIAGDLVVGERVASVGADGGFVLRGLDSAKTYDLRAYDIEGAFGGVARTSKSSAKAGEESVELAWSPGASIALQVVDADTGAPVEDFVISAGLEFAMPKMENGELLGRHPDGRVRIDDLRVAENRESATAKLEIVAEGYAPFERSDISLPRDGAVDLGVLRLEPVPLVRVTVTDRNGVPVEGATVHLHEVSAQQIGGTRSVSIRRSVSTGSGGHVNINSGDAEREATTDADGLAVLSSLPGRRAKITVDARRFADWSTDPFDLPAIGDIDREALLSRGAVAEIQVLDEAGDPLPGARVERRLQPAEGGGLSSFAFNFGGGGRVSDSEGRVFFRNLAEGVHEFRLAKEEGGSFVMNTGGGGMAAIRGFSGASSNETAWFELWLEDGDTGELVLSKASETTLSGRITEEGAPFADARIALVTDPDDPMASLGGFADAPNARTDATGAYTIEGVEPGEYTAIVKHPTRAMPHREELEVQSGYDRFDLDLDVSTISGIITNLDGDPVSGVRVRVERVQGEQEGGAPRQMVMFATTTGGGGASTFSFQTGVPQVEPAETDAEGFYELRGVPAGAKLRVLAEATDYSPVRSDTLELSRSEDRRGVDLEMEQGGGLDVTVAQNGGVPAGRVMVTARRIENGETTGDPSIELADSEGRLSFSDLGLGPWQLTARSLGGSGASDPIEVEVVAGEKQPVTIVLP